MSAHHATPRIAFASREVYPFGGGGLGASVAALAAAVAQEAEVSILTTDLHRERYEQLSAAGDPALPPGVRFVFVPEPRAEDVGSYFNEFHLWSARLYEALKEAYPEGGPDLVEFPDFLAEGAVTVQAAQTKDPALAQSRVAVRAYTSHEMCDVLNRHVSTAPQRRMLYDLERYALKYADCFFWPGGDILNTYHRFYGPGGVAPPQLVRHVVARECAEASQPRDEDGVVRLLYVGRLERRKGVVNLLRALTSLHRDDWALTLLGGDTPTASLGVSMRAQLELMAAEDERITFHPAVDRDRMFELIAQHDVSIFPSLWECWPFVALHSFDANRPVLATPVGGFVEMIEDGVSGWLTTGTDAPALARTVERILDEPGAAREAARREEPRNALARLADTADVVESYLRLVEEHRMRRNRSKTVQRAKPLVSVVVPYHRLEDYVGDTVASIFEQTHVPLEVIVVNDGSFRREDAVLAELATTYPITVLSQENAGLGAARNFGIRQSRGEYVFPLDADNMAAPEFVARCVDVLLEREDLAYVTSWIQYVDDGGRRHSPPVEGYQPVTNDAPSLDALNVAGDAAAVIRRRIFDRGLWYSLDATSYEDWLFYRSLQAHGLYGHVIPERLLRYRVRSGSMVREIGLPHHKWLLGEMEAHLREEEVRWTSSSV